MAREYDLIVYGCTGDAGRAIVECLAQTAPPTLRWAIAGRSQEKMEVLVVRWKVKSNAHAVEPHFDAIVADTAGLAA